MVEVNGTPFDPCVFLDFDFSPKLSRRLLSEPVVGETESPLESRLLFFGRLAEDRWHRQLTLFEVVLSARLDR